MHIILLIGAIVVLLILSAGLAGLTMGLLALSHHELKRKAQLGESDASKVYPIHARGNELLVTLLISSALVNSAIAVLLDSFLCGVVAVVVAALLIAVFAQILPRAYLRKYGLKLGARLSPVLNWLLAVFHPLSMPLGRLLDRQGVNSPALYSRRELRDMIEEQGSSPYGAIEEREVVLLHRALSFGDRTIREVMVPRPEVKLVAAKETIGPILLDELHDSGYNFFPVYQDEPDHIVGTLSLRSLVSGKKYGTIGDAMSHEVYYVHDEQKLDHALQAFLKTKHHLFIVTNSFAEFVGVITLADILAQITGKPADDSFDRYDDIKAVAAYRATSDSRSQQKPKSDSPEPPEVIE